MNENNEVQIKEGKRYEFILDNEEKYTGVCIREPSLNKVKGICEVGFSCHKESENENYFYDLNISQSKIKSVREMKEFTNHLEK